MSRAPPTSARSVPSSPKKPAPSISTLGGTTGSPIVRARITPLAIRSRPPSVSIPSPTTTRATPALRTSQSFKNLRSPSPIKTSISNTLPRSATPSTPTAMRRVGSGSPAVRTRSISSMSRTPKSTLGPTPTSTPTKPSLSVKEQIALKRAEARKALAKASSTTRSNPFEGLEDASPAGFGAIPEENVDLGRWSVKETIERARSTGALNLASRSLPCLPSALFEIHLGITPEPLKLVSVEPPITTSTSDDPSSSRRRAQGHTGPSWYEAQDLEILKAWSNEIVEIQPEISMFGSLKSIDLRNNKLTTLPDSFADLIALANLDLSHNHLTSLPDNFWALPSLCILNISHNSLSSLPFNAPYADGTNPLGRTVDPRGDWYSESITRATKPLPKLSSLDASHNIITASSIDHNPLNQLPSLLHKLDLSFNPLGNCVSLIRAFSRLKHLQEFQCEHAEIGDDSFPVSLFDDVNSSNSPPFPHLTILDLGETQVSKPVIEAVFLPTIIKQTLDFEVTPEPPREGVLRAIIGRRIVKEAWEVEAESRAKVKAEKHLAAVNAEKEVTSLDGFRSASPTKGRAKKVVKEEWEIEAERGLSAEGVKRRARAAATFGELKPSSSSSRASRSVSPSKTSSSRRVSPAKPKVEKEAWEIEAEQGLLTEGGRRRARAMAAMAAAGLSLSATSASSSRSNISTPATSPSPSSVSVLSNPQYYDSTTRTLKLPPSNAIVAHSRSFSLAAKTPLLASSLSSFSPASANGNGDLALAIPTPTLPLYAILTQAFSHTLLTLVLSSRRMDPSFALPLDSEGPFLPCLEELCLEGCNLGENVTVSQVQEGPEMGSGGRTSEKLLEVIPRLFPSLSSLDLSYNNLGSLALTKDGLSALILSSPGSSSRSKKAGLRHLRLRGNRLTNLDAFQELALGFKGFREVKEWFLEELDLRDNEIGRLGPELGLLPLDVFLVDGNVFRVPPRRIWEREGTKGLLSWLRGRME